MNENQQGSGNPMGNGSTVVVGLLLGALVGAGVALLLAPGSGKETRGRLVSAGRRWGGAARRTLDDARNAASDLTEDTKSAITAGRDAFQRGQNSHDPRPASQPEVKS